MIGYRFLCLKMDSNKNTINLSSSDTHNSSSSPIREFYRNKNIFISGATGFVGKVSLEELNTCKTHTNRPSCFLPCFSASLKSCCEHATRQTSTCWSVPRRVKRHRAGSVRCSICLSSRMSWRKIQISPQRWKPSRVTSCSPTWASARRTAWSLPSRWTLSSTRQHPSSSTIPSSESIEFFFLFIVRRC